MKTNTKFIRFVLAATFGSLLWAGCASAPPSVFETASNEPRPIDLTRRRPDTHPEWNTGFDRMYSPRTTINVPLETDVWNEAAGAPLRPY